MDSILVTVKKLLGLDADYNAFDTDIILHINSVFMVLNQLGVGPTSPFTISGRSETWSNFSSTTDVEALKTYMYIRVRLLFDPPDKSFVLDSYQKILQELEWRMIVQTEKEDE